VTAPPAAPATRPFGPTTALSPLAFAARGEAGRRRGARAVRIEVPRLSISAWASEAAAIAAAPTTAEAVGAA
jgi:hypothetical protein